MSGEPATGQQPPTATLVTLNCCGPLLAVCSELFAAEGKVEVEARRAAEATAKLKEAIDAAEAARADAEDAEMRLEAATARKPFLRFL